MAEPAHPLVRLAGLTHAHGRTPALRGVDLEVGAGTAVAVTGASGSGKSTLLHVAAGLLQPDAGSVQLLGHDLARLDDAERAQLRRRDVGIVLQYGQLVPDLPLLDGVALPLLLDGSALGPARDASRAALAGVGLADAEDAVPAELSGGQAQLAAVARALVAQPHLVLADEPVASLDPAGAALALDLLWGVVARGGALVLVTHDNVLAARCDREVRLAHGGVQHDLDLR
ncbi:ATP-binding cassette domain-containing protein [Quadrisphaera sp. INWT6]|nr:ATP-binding cassette domain-containing protein [Quadrisphaera sp. INWT6]